MSYSNLAPGETAQEHRQKLHAECIRRNRAPSTTGRQWDWRDNAWWNLTQAWRIHVLFGRPYS